MMMTTNVIIGTIMQPYWACGYDTYNYDLWMAVVHIHMWVDCTN